MTDIDPAALDEVREALGSLPTEEGGTIIILATAGTPPALAMLSTGDVLVDGTTVRCAVYGGASSARRLGGAFSLLVPVGHRAIRLEVSDAAARAEGDLAVLEGELVAARPTSEPPWAIDMHFFPTARDGVPEHLEYWRGAREWLRAGATGQPPDTP